jgi:hypothetical protein
VKFKLDENLPVSSVAILTSAGVRDSQMCLFAALLILRLGGGSGLAALTRQ